MAVIAAAVVAWAFMAYGGLRVFFTDHGMGPLSAVALAAGLALVLAFIGPSGVLVPIGWATGLVIAAILRSRPPFRAARRASAAKLAIGSWYCAACGYPKVDGGSARCPECGGERFATVRPPLVRTRAVLLTILIAAVGGGIVGEAWILVDVVRFRREVRQNARSEFTRPRAWPHGSSRLMYRDGVFWSVSPE